MWRDAPRHPDEYTGFVPKRSGKTFRQLTEEAAHYAAFYFNSEERARMMSYAGCSPDAHYVVLARNQFVPLDALPGSAAMLKKYVRGTGLDEQERGLLRDYWSLLDREQLSVAATIENVGPTEAACRLTRESEAWPAIGLAGSEEQLRALLIAQFECIRQARIPWLNVDCNTHTWPMYGGAYTSVLWFWHGY